MLLVKSPDWDSFYYEISLTIHCHPNCFEGPSISLARASKALKPWFYWLSTDLIYWAFGRNMAISHSILSSLAIWDRMSKIEFFPILSEQKSMF